MDALLWDIKYSVRQLRRLPLFVGAVVATLALAVGANTLLFAIANAAIFRALPYPDGARIVSPSVVQKGRDVGRMDEPTSRLAAAASLPVFESFALYNSVGAIIVGGEYPERLPGAGVSQSFFDVLATRPALGRTFADGELVPGGPAVIVLSDALWTRRFGRQTDIVGQRITLDDGAYEVIGVMPAGFRFPGSSEFWLPLYPRTITGGLYYTDAIARLDPSASIGQAQAALATLRESQKNELPAAALRSEIRVMSLHERLYGQYTRPLVVLLAVVACVVLIGCANIANLLLARSAVRRGELAIRAAVGASRGRLFRQLLAESLMLACLGAIPGLGLAYFGLQAFRSFGPPALVRLPALAIDGYVLTFALVLTIGSGLLFGLAPAAGATRVNPASGLRGGLGLQRDGRSRPRQALVIFQIAAAVVLTLGTALLAKSFTRFQAIDRGFEGENVLTASITLSTTRYPDSASRGAFFDGVIERLRTLPDVESVSVSTIGLSGLSMTMPWPPGTGGSDRTEIGAATGIGDRHFRTFGIPILDGRECGGSGDTSAIVINASMARLAYGGQSALGRSLDLSTFGFGNRVVIGVAGDVRNIETKAAPMPMVFPCAGQDRAGYGTVGVRVREGTPAMTLAPALRSVVRDLDPAQPLGRITTIEQAVREGMSSRWFDATVIGALSMLALVLALGGLYAVTAFSVAQRTREIGVRMALGADRGRVLALVLRQGGVLVSIGIALGLLAAVPLVRFVTALLFEVQPLDASVFTTVAILVGAVGTAATLIPAWRASRVDPMTVLKAE
jgi:putative ABC transport system permease protein